MKLVGTWFYGIRLSSCRAVVPPALTDTWYSRPGRVARVHLVNILNTDLSSRDAKKLSSSSRGTPGLGFQDSVNSCRVCSFGSDEWHCLSRTYPYVVLGECHFITLPTPVPSPGRKRGGWIDNQVCFLDFFCFFFYSVLCSFVNIQYCFFNIGLHMWFVHF